MRCGLGAKKKLSKRVKFFEKIFFLKKKNFFEKKKILKKKFRKKVIEKKILKRNFWKKKILKRNFQKKKFWKKKFLKKKIFEKIFFVNFFENKNHKKKFPAELKVYRGSTALRVTFWDRQHEVRFQTPSHVPLPRLGFLRFRTHQARNGRCW